MVPNFNLNSQTQLISGPTDILIDYMQNNLQKLFCKNNVCQTCVQCSQISQKNHSCILWLKPEKNYKLDQIEIVFEKIAFSLNNDEKFFIIFENAELLNQACSNKLLKSIEEPKKGYYFIFLTQRKEHLLPTIVSRCIVTNFYKNNNFESNSELFNFFISQSNPVLFLKTLEEININEQESIELLDSLIKHWSNKLKSDLQNYNKLSSILNIFIQALNKLPMPGSSKIFWKNLYLKFQQIY